MTAAAKLLIVDDEASVRRVLNRFLASSGYEVIECADGQEVSLVVARESPDLVLLDVEMPVMDGWTTLRNLRASGCNVPVLMLTNIADVPARVKGLEAGADDYLGKPCDFGELNARITALLRRSGRSGSAGARLEFGDLTIDLKRRVARRGAQQVHFTRTEFALLELLSGQKGVPLARERVIRAVWNSAATGSSHTLDTCLWRLRNKLGRNSQGASWIRNLPGIGYLLECEPGDWSHL